MALRCAYHPEREASAKCRKCGKVICLECLIKQKYCQLCYYDIKIKEYGRSTMTSTACIVTILTGFLIMILSLASRPDMNTMGVISISMWAIIPIACFSIYGFIYSPIVRARPFKEKKEQFLNSLKL